MKRIFFGIFLTLFFSKSFSQCMAIYQDISNYVYVADGGESKYLEALPLLSYKIGRAGILAYVPNNGRLKVYYKGKIYPVTDNTPNYYMTDNWFLYQNYNLIKVMYHDEFKTLETLFTQGTDSLFYSDSLIVWQNDLGELNVFFEGQTQMIERGATIHKGRIGPNIFAYMDQASNFKVFYGGQMQVLESYEPSSYQVNQDMLVYFDQYNNLKIYHDGVLDETSTPAPSEYRLGKDFLAYISSLRQLVVYYKGEETVLMDDHPLKWLVRANLMVYTDKGNNFWAWYKGQKYLLERYIPLSYKVENDIVVYQDLDGRLKAFSYGQQVEVSDQIVPNYALFNETVRYSLMPYETKIWCRGQTYTFK
jgi:hypothetical protein